METLDWIEFMSADVEVLPRFRKRVEERDAAGLCLLCDKQATRRGLCDHHHYEFRMERLQTPKSKKRFYENNRVRQGTLMPDRQGQRVKQRRQEQLGKAS